MEFVLTVLAWASIAIGGWYFTQANPKVKKNFKKVFILSCWLLVFVIFVQSKLPIGSDIN